MNKLITILALVCTHVCAAADLTKLSGAWICEAADDATPIMVNLDVDKWINRNWMVLNHQATFGIISGSAVSFDTVATTGNVEFRLPYGAQPIVLVARYSTAHPRSMMLTVPGRFLGVNCSKQ